MNEISKKIVLIGILISLNFIIPAQCFSDSNILVLSETKSIIFPDFDQGMMRGGRSRKKYRFNLSPKATGVNSEKLKKRLQLLRSHYNNVVSIIKTNQIESNSELHIPKIVHQIWLGSNVPHKYFEWMKSWMNWMGWEYKLWTDKEVKQLRLINQNLYDKVSNYGAKSDILRMELLYTMGGMYIDTDFECLNPDFFEVLHRNVDFYIGIEPLEHSLLRINNAIMGSSPGHPLLEKMIHDLPEHLEANKKKWALVSTGPVFISKVIFNYLEQDHKEINFFLPPSLVYPFTSREVDRSSSQNDLIPMKESVAIHYWSKSWVK